MEYVIRNNQMLKWSDQNHPCPQLHWEIIRVVGKDWRNEDKTLWTVMCVKEKGCGKCKKEVKEEHIKKFYAPF